MPFRAFAVLLFCVAGFAGIAARAGGASATPDPAATPVYDPSALPPGLVGDSIRYGRAIVMDTRRYMKGNVGAQLDCAACHIDGGTKPYGGSFVGTAAFFPQYNKRANRVITLHDRLSECFLYSMNGRPPDSASKEMVALVAYIDWLSRGKPVFSTPGPENHFVVPVPSASPNVANGAHIYAAQCAVCHQANGAGIAGAFPPLWGSGAFNSGAGMAHIDRMTGFVMHNMPQNAPDSLSLTDAYDVSGYVLTHERPAFSPNALIQASPLPADYY